MPPTEITSRTRMAHWFHALADETRLRILECLQEGEQCVCDLTETLNASQSRLSFHLKILKEAGILMDRREGRWMYYTVNPETLKEVVEALQALHPPPASRPEKRYCR